MLYMTKRSQIFLVPPPGVTAMWFKANRGKTKAKKKISGKKNPKKQKQNKKGQTLVVSAPLWHIALRYQVI